MRKRIAATETNHQIRKRKRLYNNEKKSHKSTSSSSRSSSDLSDSNECVTPQRNGVANIVDENSPNPVFILSRDLVNGTILTDIQQKKWRIGKPIGKGSFGEIFLASDDINIPVTSYNAKYVVKIEPHSNGPLFVEIHCLLHTTKKKDERTRLPGLPDYIASGSHYFRDARYRFLVIPRFDKDLYSLIKHRKVDQKSLLILAVQTLEVLEILHDTGYCHSDIKSENLMISKCTYKKNKNSNSLLAEICYDEEVSKRSLSRVQRNRCSPEESEEDDFGNEEADAEEEENESEDEGNCSQSESVSEDDVTESEISSDSYKTPLSKRSRNRQPIQYGGSNPLRSCRVNGKSKNTSTTSSSSSSIYQEMVKSHYLRPAKRINYAEYFMDDIPKASDTASKQLSPSSSTLTLTSSPSNYITVTEDRLFLIDFGLASKFLDTNGTHKPFVTDQRRAHDGTLEFTSRDAHLGAHSRRSDLECFGYNLIFWSEGYLPWKEYANQQQLEKVHWMKEYLMTDVREMLKHIYGESVPKYLGEYMHYVSKLGYQERPDYNRCKQLFIKEYKSLGYDVNKMSLNVEDISKNALRVLENNNCELKHIKSIMKNLGVIMPLTLDSTSACRISPKSLRSKSDKKTNESKSPSKKKKFSWTEILSKDPDQIARERAEKEFEKEANETPLIKYSGKPTYAILEIEKRLKFKDRLDAAHNSSNDEDDVLLEGYNKPMMAVLKKRQANMLKDDEFANSNSKATESAKATTTNGNGGGKKKRGRPRRIVVQSTTISSTHPSTDEYLSSSSSSSTSSSSSSSSSSPTSSSSNSRHNESDEQSTEDMNSKPVKARHTSKVNGSTNNYNLMATNGSKLIGAQRRKRNVPKRSDSGVTRVIRKIKNSLVKSRIRKGNKFKSDIYYNYEVENFDTDNESEAIEDNDSDFENPVVRHYHRSAIKR